MTMEQIAQYCLFKPKKIEKIVRTDGRLSHDYTARCITCSRTVKPKIRD